MNQNILSARIHVVRTASKFNLLRFTLVIWSVEFALGISLGRKPEWKRWVWGSFSLAHTEARIWPLSAGWAVKGPHYMKADLS